MTPAFPPIVRPDLRFLLAHPAHFIALGAGSGLSRKAPGTVGTLWGWAAFLLLQALWQPSDIQWAATLGLMLLGGWWAAEVTALHMGIADPGHIVIDEIVAFWLVLWLITPCGWLAQFAAFVLFRYFDIDITRPERPALQRYYQNLTTRPAFREHVMVSYEELRVV